MYQNMCIGFAQRVHITQNHARVMMICTKYNFYMMHIYSDNLYSNVCVLDSVD